MKSLASILAALVAIALLIAALYGWQHAAALAALYEQPLLVTWAIRLFAIGLACAAQVLILTLVVGRIYSRRRFERIFILTATAFSTLAFASAIALGLAGR